MLRILLPVTLMASAAAAQTPPIATEGLRLSRQWCAACHAVSRDMPPPAGDAVPGFAAIAAMASTTETGLRVFLQTPHANMPNFQLSRAEVDAVVAYLLSLRR